MGLPQTQSRWPVTVLLLVAALALAAWWIGMAGNQEGLVALPGPAGADGKTPGTVEFLADDTGRLGLEEVRSRPDAAWREWDGRGYINSVAGGAVWMRVTLRNSGERLARGALADQEYYTDVMEMWIQDAGPGAGWRRELSGEWAPAREKALWGRDTAFLVDVPARGERVVYLRAADNFGCWVRPVWWPDERHFFSAQLRGMLVEGSYFGLMLALLIYNLVLWLRLRFADIGHYLGYLGAMAVFMAFWRGLHQIAGLPLGSPRMEMTTGVALSMTGVFMTLFARQFFDLAAVAPRTGRVVCGLGWTMGVLAAGSLFAPWAETTLWLHLTVACTMVTHATLLVAAVLAWRAGAVQARYFVYSFGVFFVGVAPTASIWLQSIPLGVSAIVMMTGSALEMLLLSLAMADRFAGMQREKIEAQARVAEEAEQRRAIQEAYADELEVEVRERTRELEAANADKDRMLTVIGHDLRSPLTGLTRSAEQAAEGRVSGVSFAADAARTGRALLLLIEDLVLWARLRAGSVHVGRHPAGALVAPAVAQHRAVAEQRGVELSIEVADGLMVETDLVLAQTLARNLLANALKFAGTRVRLSVAAADGDRVRVTVRDDGPGLPAAVEAALASDGAGAWPAEGGLGLRLCAEIGRALKTRLEARRVEGGGTEFGFTLSAAGVRKEVAA